MRINKWIPIVLGINIGVLCFALYVATTYQQQNYIVSCEQPITNYSILEVNCRGHRMHSTVKIAYAGKDYYVGVSRELCKNILTSKLGMLYYKCKENLAKIMKRHIERGFLNG